MSIERTQSCGGNGIPLSVEWRGSILKNQKSRSHFACGQAGRLPHLMWFGSDRFLHAEPLKEKIAIHAQWVDFLLNRDLL
jgi:hypothetical protein